MDEKLLIERLNKLNIKWEENSLKEILEQIGNISDSYYRRTEICRKRYLRVLKICHEFEHIFIYEFYPENDIMKKKKEYNERKNEVEELKNKVEKTSKKLKFYESECEVIGQLSDDLCAYIDNKKMRREKRNKLLRKPLKKFLMKKYVMKNGKSLFKKEEKQKE